MRALLLAAIVVGLGALGGGDAHAYPQFQLSTGTARCSQCHFSPAGGGLINGYGRFIAGDELSNGTGDAAFLHGLWSPPEWLSIGGDLRYAGLVNDSGGEEGGEVAAFPMQADLYLRLAAGAFSVNATGGVRGAARPRNSSVADRLVSREHYVMWQPEATGVYVRAGRYFAPYGLRNVEHTMFVRRYLGFNTLEETYNLSAGLVEAGWELHATAFTPALVQPVGHRGTGGALYYERRILEDTAVWGVQARAALGPDDDRYTAGGIGKYYLEGPRLLFMGELDYGLQRIAATDTGFDGASRHQLTSHLSTTWFPTQGWMVGGTLESRIEDLEVRGVARNAVSLQLHWFLRAHVEVLLYGRTILIGNGRPASLGMLQLHYYL